MSNVPVENGPVVIVGAGQAGFSIAAKLRDLGHCGRITLIGTEPHPPYQRPPLSKGYLLGDLTEERLYLRPLAFYAICPGWIMTEMASDGFDLARDPARAKADAIARHPAGRLGQPSDIANAVAWLVSDQAAFATGQCFVLDGGLTAASSLQPGLF